MQEAWLKLDFKHKLPAACFVPDTKNYLTNEELSLWGKQELIDSTSWPTTTAQLYAAISPKLFNYLAAAGNIFVLD